MTRIALICPAVRPAVSQLADATPLATVPILGECLVNHWVENLAAHGVKEIFVFAADRADEVRRVVGDGRRWGVQVTVRECGIEPGVPEVNAQIPGIDHVVVMNYLPGVPGNPLFESYAGWYAAVAAWVPLALTPARVRVSEVRPGIWMNRRAHISPRAQVIGPCWIGDQAMIRADAIVGPGAVIEDRAVIDVGARVVESIVGADTYVGRMSSVANSIAIGETLINWKSDSWLRVPDPFLLCSLVRPGTPRREPMLRTLSNFLAKFTARPVDQTVSAVSADRRTTP